MPSETAPSDGVDQRLHPSSALFILISALRGFLFPFVAVVFLSRGSSMLLYVALFGVIPVMLAFLVKYISYRYRLDRVELVIKEGILTRNERHIPYARIQNIDLLQNPLHRMLGVAEARLETASGGKPEAVIRVLSLDAVSEMRRRVFAGRDGAHDSTSAAGAAGDVASGAAGPPPLLQLPLREIVIYGLISNRGMVVVAAAFGALSQTGFWDFDEDAVLERVNAGLPESWQLGVFEQRWTQIVFGVVVFILAAIVLMRVLSVALAVIKLYGFTLTRRGDDLRAEYGLLTRVSTTIPVHRIQTLSTRQSMLHRLFGRASIQVETAGGGRGGQSGESDGGGIERQWLAPVIPSAQVAALVQSVLADVDLEPDWQKVEQRAWRRRVKGVLFLLGLVTTGLVLGLHRSAALLLLPGVTWAVWWARRSVAAEGWALSPHAIYYRSGFLGRRLSVVLFGKIQALARFQSPLDRRHRMSRVQVDTAGATRIGHRVDIPYLDSEIADGLLERLYAEASLTAFRW